MAPDHDYPSYLLTLHAWQSRLRLLSGLERVAEPGIDLGEVANDLGYASHSHFTTAFRRAFGITPSAFRATASARRVRELADRIASIPGGFDVQRRSFS